jgi:DNA invertase Pin-like site-specific DNA recombinase
VVEQLGSLGVDLVSLGDPGLDTTGPSGRLLFHVMGAVAEFERDLIRERVRAGMQAAKKRGRRIGRPRASVPLSKARALVDQGASVSAAARELGVSRATLQRGLILTIADKTVPEGSLFARCSRHEEDRAQSCRQQRPNGFEGERKGQAYGPDETTE